MKYPAVFIFCGILFFSRLIKKSYATKDVKIMKRAAISILAHVDSGKTTLTEALMYCSGNLKKFGRVDHGDSFLDTYSVERERGITVFSKQAVLSYKDSIYTLLDTPGHADFSAETERTLQIPDYAVLVISGTDGIQSHTVTLWKLLERYSVPCFIFVNKMDLDGADRSIVLAKLKDRFGDGCIDFAEEGSGGFYEELAVCSDEMLEEFDSSAVIKHESIIKAINRRQVFPCMFGSALKLSGIREFLECLDRFTVMPEYKEEFAAKVFKIGEDKQKNRLTFMKITGGSLKVRDMIPDSKNKNGEKVNRIFIYSGDKFTCPDEVQAGTVCAVTGLTFTRCGDCLGAQEKTLPPVLQPVLSYSLILPENVNVHTALEKLRCLEQEDPQLRVSFDEKSGAIGLRLMGDIQLEILKRLIYDRFGFEVGFDQGHIIYKETIENIVEGVGHFEPLRHYAEVHLIFKPAPRNSGLLFRSECREEMLDRTKQRLILSMLYEYAHKGVLTGAPVTDMEIILAAGRDHIKHTVGGDLREAAFRALRQGLRIAESVLLEPMYDFTMEIPSENTGRAISDIQKMSAEFDSPVTEGEFTVITGRAPVSEMCNYNREIVQYTHGQGKLLCTFGGYEKCHNSEEVISQTGYDPDSDTDNPCDSVFCSHGAGHIVKWNEVKNHMHVSSVLREEVSEPVQNRRQNSAASRKQSDIFAADKELMDIFESTYGPVRRKSVSERVEYHAAPKASTQSPKTQKQQYEGPEYVLVDGYNVIYAWNELNRLSKESLDAARNRLVNILCNYRGYRKCELILVFDAYKVKGNVREIEQVGGINIVYTKEAETADMYIEKVTRSLTKKHRVRVVTSDGMEQLIILGGGALRVSSAAFLSEVRQTEKEIEETIMRRW